MHVLREKFALCQYHSRIISASLDLLAPTADRA
jgi:hypothetical protein